MRIICAGHISSIEPFTDVRRAWSEEAFLWQYVVVSDGRVSEDGGAFQLSRRTLLAGAGLLTVLAALGLDKVLVAQRAAASGTYVQYQFNHRSIVWGRWSPRY